MPESRSVDRTVQKHICAYQISIYTIRMSHAGYNCATCKAYAQVMRGKAQMGKNFSAYEIFHPFAQNRELKYKGAK